MLSHLSSSGAEEEKEERKLVESRMHVHMRLYGLLKTSYSMTVSTQNLPLYGQIDIKANHHFLDTVKASLSPRVAQIKLP